MARQGYPPLSAYRIAGRSVDTTITGHFVDGYGQIVGNPFSGVASASGWSTLANVSGVSIPTNAVGCILGSVSADTVILTTDAAGVEPDLALAQANVYFQPAGTTGIQLGFAE